MKVDAYASQAQYADHIRPIFDALPEGLRGSFDSLDRESHAPIIVASYIDLWKVRRRPVILVEHGAGQSYSGRHPAYPGGTNREAVRLFICPSETVARRNLERYPKAKAAVVGCPRMDRWLPATSKRSDIIAISFHWNATVVPEARSALAYYRQALPLLAERYRIIATAHPRLWREAQQHYERAGLEAVQDSGEVFDRAGLLLVDNSSIGWEFLALGRPVVWLNAPWYRRSVNHGLRFWDLATSGVQCDDPSGLVASIAEAVCDSPEQQRRRREAVEQVYVYTDGTSSARAAAAIQEAFR